jgi:hypothetical protein
LGKGDGETLVKGGIPIGSTLVGWLFLFSMDLKVGCRTIKTTPSFSAFLRTHTRKRTEGAKGMVMEAKPKKSGPLSDQPIAFPERKKLQKSEGPFVFPPK